MELLKLPELPLACRLQAYPRRADQYVNAAACRIAVRSGAVLPFAPRRDQVQCASRRCTARPPTTAAPFPPRLVALVRRFRHPTPPPSRIAARALRRGPSPRSAG